MPTAAQGLVRTIGRWTMAALMLNTIIGASIFGLPSLLAARLGALSPLGYLIAALGIGAIAACLAEVASQFRDAGGPYLYARTCFGPFAAIQIGWLNWLSRILASAAAADLFVSYLRQFYPAAEAWAVRAFILSVLVGFLAVVNYLGVSSGARLSNFFTISKLSILLLFMAAGAVAILFHPGVRVTPPAMAASRSDWLNAVLLMINSYGGFEAAFLVSAEARDPRRDGPIALLIAITTATFLNIGVQYIVIHTLANSATSAKPVADAALQFMGPFGALLMAAGALISVCGYLGASMLHTPRLTFAMGEQGDFPRIFAAVHPRFHTPHVSIAAYAVLLVAFSIAGNFQWNATLSAVSRLVIYASIAAALPVLRSSRPNADAFRLPGAVFFVVLAIAFAGTLVTKIQAGGLTILGITSLLAFLNWMQVARSSKIGKAGPTDIVSQR
jgi:basic amino acid/polyamine antiporter, APA family